ncbi:MAG: hypothetical protein V1914_04775 [archaeon]
MKLILLIATLLLISGCATTSNEEQIIGGDTDEGGCLIGAGYQTDEDVGCCIRNWELNSDQRQAAKIAAEHIGKTNGLTVESVETKECEGCFTVAFKRNNEQVFVLLENWKVGE